MLTSRIHPKRFVRPGWAIAAAAMLVLAGCSSAASGSSSEQDGSQAAPSSNNPKSASATNQSLGLVTPGVLTASAVGSQVPMSMVGDNGEPEGFAVALMKEIAKRLDLKPSITVRDVASSLSRVSNDQDDIMIAATGITKERSSKMYFSIGWYWAPSIFVFNKGKTFASADDLSGKTVGVVTATQQESTMDANFPDIIKKQFHDQSSEINALKAGQVDAVFLGGVNATSVTKEDSSLVLGPVVPAGHASSFALAEGNDALRAAIDSQIVQIIDDGTFLKLWNKWVDFPPDDNIFKTYPALQRQADHYVS